MCGITGIFHISQPGPVSLDLLERMTGALSHRGPDGSGVYLDDRVGLGHTRLSIIDLSGGAQPIHNEDETLWIVYNGEVFNYPELREDLIRRGHRFYTGTDTEVILHLYEDRGVRCLEEMNGQFAFAIWDAKKKEMFLARDRTGILPLHYAVHRDTLIFASEIKSIFTVKEVERSIDPVAVDQIFTFWTTLPGRTTFKGIHEVPAGHYLKAAKGRIEVRKYWDLPFASPKHYTDRPIAALRAELMDLILDAVRIRLRADVPVGCYLSGGLDSSAVTTLTRRHFENSLRTFGIGFEESSFDEGVHQRFMVEFLNTEHTNVLATNRDIGMSLPGVMWHCEKPILRTSPVPLFLLSRAVRRNEFKVVLTGEGADEVFGGYNIFREAKIRRFWAREPGSRWRPLLINRLYPYIFHDKGRAGNFVRSFFGQGIDDPANPLFSHLVRWNNTSRTKTFFSDGLRESIGGYSCYDDLRESLPGTFQEWDCLSKAQYLETKVFMSNYLLSSQGDRVAMAHGVEIRPPFLDHRIMEFMGNVPPRLKIRGLNEKYLLKEVFRGVVPDRILARPKQPYRAPITEGLLGPAESLLQDYLSDRFIRTTGLFNVSKVNMLIDKLKRTGHGGEVDGMALAGILTAHMIHDLFVSGFDAGSSRLLSAGLVVDRRTARVA